MRKLNLRLPKITQIVQTELGIKVQLLATHKIKLLRLRKQEFNQKQTLELKSWAWTLYFLRSLPLNLSILTLTSSFLGYFYKPVLTN